MFLSLSLKWDNKRRDSANESGIQVLYKYQDIVKPFSSVVGHYKYCRKVTQKFGKSFRTLLTYPAAVASLQIIWSFSKKNLDKNNPKSWKLKRNYLESNETLNWNVVERRYLHHKIWSIKDWLKRSKYYMLSALDIVYVLTPWLAVFVSFTNVPFVCI